MEVFQTTSPRPYNLRAVYEWLIDNNLKPYVLIDVLVDGVIVPQEYVENGKIVLDISREAATNIHLYNKHIEFDVRFGGKSFSVFLPMQSILAIYDKKNGLGIVFDAEESIKGEDKPVNKKPLLRVVS